MPLFPATPRPHRTRTLEPLRPALVRVSLAHLALAGLALWWIAGVSESARFTVDASPTPAADADNLQWFRPAEFQAPVPLAEPFVPQLAEAEPPAPAKRAAARYITLSRVAPPAQMMEAPEQSLSPPGPRVDAAARSQLDRLDEALYEAFMRCWNPPGTSLPAKSRRMARLDVHLHADVTLVKADLVAPSGSADLDLSVLMAADQVANSLRHRHRDGNPFKFPAALPSAFEKTGYVCRIQFQIE